MNQIAINFDSPPGPAAAAFRRAAVDAAVLAVLATGPRASLQILTALWDEYKWIEDVEPAINRLLASGQITQIGTTKPPEGWNPMNGKPIIDQIYAIQGVV